MKKKLLIIGFVWPEPKSSAAGSRMMQLIELFKAKDYEITFVSSSKRSDKAADLQELEVNTAIIELNSASFNTFINDLNPDIVLFDRFMTEEQFGWRVSEQCPDAIKILDTEDLHFLRRARQMVSKTGDTDSKLNLFNDTAKREIASIYRCDLSLIISKFEMRLLIETFNIDPRLLHYLPFLIDDLEESEMKNHQPFTHRHHFMTIGNFLHQPNFDALRYLKETLWKPIRKALPDVELHNYGAYATEKVHQLHNEKEGFLIKGFADDVDTIMQSSKVLLAPIRFGAGLKGKLFDAMRNGLPYVSSSIGVEGILDVNEGDFTYDHPEDFIEEAIRLYSDSVQWETKKSFGYGILRNKFSRHQFERLFDERLSRLETYYKTERQDNFIGQMLQHHSLQSTKYMSKWIELKNQKNSI